MCSVQRRVPAAVHRSRAGLWSVGPSQEGAGGPEPLELVRLGAPVTRGLCQQTDRFIGEQDIAKVSFKFFRLIFNPILPISVVGLRSSEKDSTLFPVLSVPTARR